MHASQMCSLCPAQPVIASSTVVGNGSFLFYVLVGVRSGCHLGSILFLLCVSRFIHFFKMFSGNQGCSTTRVCTDDFGSDLRMFPALRTNASISNSAQSEAGFQLKPSGCVLIVSATPLSDESCFVSRTG